MLDLPWYHPTPMILGGPNFFEYNYSWGDLRFSENSGGTCYFWGDLRNCLQYWGDLCPHHLVKYS